MNRYDEGSYGIDDNEITRFATTYLQIRLLIEVSSSLKSTKCIEGMDRIEGM